MVQWIAKLFGKIAPRVASGVAKPIAAGSASHALESLEDRKVMSGSLSHGIVVNTLSSRNYNTTLNMLHDTGTKSVRMWVGINSYANHREDGTFKYIRKLHSAGIDITIAAVPRNGLRGSASQVQSYFSWLGGALGGSVDRWEIGNEVDMSWRGRLPEYVNTLLKPAAAALHGRGEKVVSGSVSWDPRDIQTMVNAGMLSYVDFVGYHPYRASVKDLQDCVSQVKSLVRGKPLLATEWCPRGQNNSASWNAMIQAFWPTIRDNFYGAYYYAAFRSGTMAGSAGIMSGTGGGHNGAYYATYKGLTGNGGNGSLPTVPVPTPPLVTTFSKSPAATTTKSPAAAKPVVTGFKLLDARTGKSIKGFENITASATIKLKALPTRYVQVEAITSGVSSVQFGFTGRDTRLENYASFTAFATKSGTATGWNAGAGSYKLTATAYAGRFGTGEVGNKLGLYLTFR